MKKLLLVLIIIISGVTALPAAELPEPQEPYPYLSDGDTLSAEWLMSYFQVLYEWARQAEGRLGTSTIDISNLFSAVASNSLRLDELEAQVATNILNIAQNTSAIASNSLLIAQNTSAIASNSLLIAQNTSAIASNSLLIASLTARVVSAEIEIDELWANFDNYRPIGTIKEVGPGYTITDADAWCYLRVNGGLVSIGPNTMQPKTSIEIRDTSGSGLSFPASLARSDGLATTTYGFGTVSLIKIGEDSWEIVGELEELEE